MIDVQKAARPAWLRPGAVALVLGLHALAVMTFGSLDLNLTASDDKMDLTIAQGEPEPDPPAQPAAEEPPPPPPEPTPAPPDPQPPQPQVPTPPEPPPPEPPPPEPPPPEEPPPKVEEPPTPQPDPVKREVTEAVAIPVKPKPKPRPPEIKKPVEKPPETPAEQSAPGQRQAVDNATQMQATYIGKVLAEIRAHRIATFGSGAVRVGFSIDAAGNVTAVRVVQSSGKDSLDETALKMVRAIHPGPPPDGAFQGTTTINFVAQ